MYNLYHITVTEEMVFKPLPYIVLCCLLTIFSHTILLSLLLLPLLPGLYLQQQQQNKNKRFVEIAMEAMDNLLQACHAQTTLNLFVESFLRMVQKLLEDSNPNLQILATNSVSCVNLICFN